MQFIAGVGIAHDDASRLPATFLASHSHMPSTDVWTQYARFSGGCPAYCALLAPGSILLNAINLDERPPGPRAARLAGLTDPVWSHGRLCKVEIHLFGCKSAAFIQFRPWAGPG